MSAPIAKKQLSFELPKLSFVNARWEEPELFSPVPSEPPRGFAHWLASRVAAFRAWRERDIAMGELSMMTDRELMDIGLTRSDIKRVFSAGFRQDAAGRVA